MLQLPACCLRNRKYCLDPVQPSRQNGYSSYGVMIRSIRRTLPLLVMNMPNTLSNLYTDAIHTLDRQLLDVTLLVSGVQVVGCQDAVASINAAAVR